MHEIEVANINIEVVRKDIKNLHLAVYPPDGRVRIASPLRIDDESVRLFAISKLSWIKRHQHKFRAQEREPLRDYINGESHYYQGQRYLLNLLTTNGNPKVHIRNANHIDLYVKEGASREEKERTMINWYRKQLKSQIPDLIAKWEPLMNVKVRNWGVKRMRTKWGTCNIEDGRIWINLELAKKSRNCLEYILVHEMVHLLERHHNDRFIAYMDRFLPNWRLLRDELNRAPLSHIDWGY